MNLIQENAQFFDIDSLCLAFDIPRATYYRYLKSLNNSKLSKKRISNRAISQKEKYQVLEILNNDENIDISPRQIFYSLLDKGVYLCSESSFYRILRENNASKERRRLRNFSGYAKPELIALYPNHVWSWDVSKLKGPVKFMYFYLYTIIDIYSKYVVGWMVADRELAENAKNLFQKTFEKQGVIPKTLTIHSDNGPIMKADLVKSIYDDIGITKSYSRPYVSDDNPFSEANFKTLKYRHDYPDRFASIEETEVFLIAFYNWYNNLHFHSGIKMLTPYSVHYGTQTEIVKQRQVVMVAAKEKLPERFLGKKGFPSIFEEPVYINKPYESVT